MAESIYRILGQSVRRERDRAGYTQEELGEKAEITGAYVAHVERGTKHATLETVAKIAHALGVSVANLLQEQASQNGKNDQTIQHFARVLRGRTPKQKQALLRVVTAAAGLIS